VAEICFHSKNLSRQNGPNVNSHDGRAEPNPIRFLREGKNGELEAEDLTFT